MIQVIVYGILLGLGAALAPGPVNLELVRRAFMRGPKFAFAFGVGVVSVDMAYLYLASTGAAAILAELGMRDKALLAFVSSAILAGLGYMTLRVTPAQLDATQNLPVQAEEISATTTQPSLIRNYALGFLLTATSPTTIAYWIGVSVWAAHHLPDLSRMILPFVVTVGVTCLLWVLTVVTVSGFLHRRLNTRALLAAERLLGIGLLICAAISAYEGFRYLRGARLADRNLGHMYRNTFRPSRVAFHTNPPAAPTAEHRHMSVATGRSRHKPMPSRPHGYRIEPVDCLRLHNLPRNGSAV